MDFYIENMITVNVQMSSNFKCNFITNGLHTDIIGLQVMHILFI